MPSNVVSMIKYKNISSVAEVIEECGGFKNLKRGDRVLVKPNLVGWDNNGPYPPWGVLTTSAVMEGVCAALKDAGAGSVEIGEASIKCKAIGSGTTEIYGYLGYRKLVDKYGVKLTDFNKEDFDEVEIDDGHKIKITKRVKDCDFLLNVPVLKTHGHTVVTLAMKNLKGLMHARSKSYFHHPDNLLDHFISLLAAKYPPSLSLIDGVYACEKGPLHFGIAHRYGLLVASTDVYAADVLGSHILGYDVDDVAYLIEWAERHGRSKNVGDLDIRGGLDPAAERKPLDWDWEWLEDDSGPPSFKKYGVKNVKLYKYDHTLCTGCSYMFNPLMLILMSSKKESEDLYEILTGMVMEPSPDAEKTFLFGKCPVDRFKDGRGCANAIPIKGCPPSLDTIIKVLCENGVPVSLDQYDKYRRYIMDRYLSKPDIFKVEDFYMGEIPPEAAPRV